MYYSIQTQAGYATFKIGPNGALDPNKRNDGSVSVLMKNGEYHKLPFGGFVEAANIIGIRRLKIQGVVALCDDESANEVAYPIPKDHFVVGTYLNGRVFILTYLGEVKHFLDKAADQDTTNNVYSI